MTYRETGGPMGVVLVDDAVHEIRSSGHVGGKTECLLGFQWAEERASRLLRDGRVVDVRSVGHSSKARVTCLMCLGRV